MKFADILNTNQEDYYILFNKRAVVRFFLLFVQYSVKIWIVSFKFYLF